VKPQATLFAASCLHCRHEAAKRGAGGFTSVSYPRTIKIFCGKVIEKSLNLIEGYSIFDFSSRIGNASIYVILHLKY